MFITIKKLFNSIKNITQFYSIMEQMLSSFIKRRPLLFKFLVLFLDSTSRIIGFFLANKVVYTLFCLSLFIFPIFYNAELFEYYKYLGEVGFNMTAILDAFVKYFPFHVICLMFLFLLMIIIVALTTPLLFISCLTQELQSKYGVNILKLRGCNSKAAASQKIIGLAFCFVCGQDTAGRVIGHNISTNAWGEAIKVDPNIPQPKYTGALDHLSAHLSKTINALRGK